MPDASGLNHKELQPFPIGVVVSCFNTDITELLHRSAMQRLQERGFSNKWVHQLKVPGAFEIPLACQILIKQHQLSAVIALGAVIRGETNHYDYVCQQVSQGCQQVALSTSVPVIFGVLTTETAWQALARANGEHSHRGQEAVDSAIAMVAALRQIN